MHSNYNPMNHNPYDSSSYNNYVDPRIQRQSNGYPINFSTGPSN